jgi:hypothetical protein
MKILLTLLLAAVLVAACVPAIGDNAVSYPSYPDASYPDSAAGSMPANENFAPMPSDEGMTRAEAYLDGTELLTLESYPLQFMLNLKGNLPNPCHQLRIAVSAPDAENRVNVDVYSIADPDQVCVQALAPFEVNYPLGSFPAGMYSLWVNGEKVADFQS